MTTATIISLLRTARESAARRRALRRELAGCTTPEDFSDLDAALAR